MELLIHASVPNGPTQRLSECARNQMERSGQCVSKAGARYKTLTAVRVLTIRKAPPSPCENSIRPTNVSQARA